MVSGCVCGALLMYWVMRKKTVFSPVAKEQANVGPTVPVDPVYEEVSPNEEIELNTITKLMDHAVLTYKYKSKTCCVLLLTIVCKLCRKQKTIVGNFVILLFIVSLRIMSSVFVIT